MLAKKYRLPIQSVLGKRGKTIRTPFFLIKIFPNSFSYSRFGIIISKKVAPKAAERNWLKRIIFSALDPLRKSGYDFLIIADPKIKNLKKTEVKKYVSGRLFQSSF